MAGTTNYPTKSKEAEGRIIEVIKLAIHDARPSNAIALGQLAPHPEYDACHVGRVGIGGTYEGIVRNNDGKVANGLELYFRNMVLASISNFLKNNGADPSIEDVFSDWYPTFEANLATLDDPERNTRWTSHHGQAALRQRVANTLKRLRSGRLAEQGLYSHETGVGRELAEQKAAERVDKEFRDHNGAKVQPFDLFGTFVPPVFPRGILPPVLEDFAFTMGETMGTDPAGIAMGALGVCAAAIPDQVKLKVKVYENWSERACIWPALIGTPSTKKSPMLELVAKPLIDINAKLVAEHQEVLELWERQDKETRGKKPKSKRKVVDVATSEALQDVLENNTSGLLCLQDELSGLFGRIEKYGGKGGGADRAFWLRLYNGGQYSVDRVNRGSFMIENASVVLVGGIQPDKLLEIASGTADDGMLQRITPVFLSRATVGRDEPIPDVVGRYNQLIADLAGHGSGFMGHSYIRFSKDAQAYRAEMEKTNVALMGVDTFNTKLSARFGKYDGLFARLCVVFHCIETVGGNIRSEVSLATAERVGRLLYDYILRNDLCFYSGLLGLADNHDLVKDVAGYILARGLNDVRYRDLHRTTQQLKKTDHAMARRLFEQLSALGWGTVSEAKNMTAAPKFTVNPEVHRLFVERAEIERAQREATVALLSELAGQKS